MVRAGKFWYCDYCGFKYPRKEPHCPECKSELKAEWLPSPEEIEEGCRRIREENEATNHGRWDQVYE